MHLFGCGANRRNIQIFLRFYALPAGLTPKITTYFFEPKVNYRCGISAPDSRVAH